MAEYRTKGIILRRKNVGEADRLYSILTLSKGKVTAKARGVRRITSRQAGHLEPFYMSSFHLVAGRQHDIITQAMVEEDFPGLHGDLQKIGLASRLAELVDTLLEDYQPLPAVFELLHDALAVIDAAPAGTIEPFLTRVFELKLMAELGYAPELGQCVIGEEKYDARQAYHFHIGLGGLICPDHQGRHPGQPVSREAIAALTVILSAPFREAVTADFSLSTKNEVSILINRFLIYHLDPKLKSVKVAKDLQGRL